MNIEAAIKQELTGDDQRKTLELVSFLRTNEMEFIRGDGYWANQYYWYVRYMGEDVCYILVNGTGDEEDSAPLAVWSDTSDSSISAWYESYPLDEHAKEIAWSNVDYCGKCSPGSLCYGGIRKTVFGKEFNGVCRCTFRFDKPNESEMECIRNLAEIRKSDIISKSGRIER